MAFMPYDDLAMLPDATLNLLPTPLGGAKPLKVVAVCSSKGGAGKTTLSQCLAVEALRQGMAAAIIDTDPQKSATDWGHQREQAGISAPAVVPLGSRSLLIVIKELADRGAAFAVIDTPPHSAPAINAAMEVSAAAILVTRPNPMDIRALEATWTIVDRMKKPAATIFTQTPPGSRARALALSMNRLKELGIPYCPTPLTYTLGFPYAQAEALAVQEREPTSKARAEVAEVWGCLKRKAIF
jgi:chromosome partitioning protein